VFYTKSLIFSLTLDLLALDEVISVVRRSADRRRFSGALLGGRFDPLALAFITGH
jgi:hypothetical protein